MNIDYRPLIFLTRHFRAMTFIWFIGLMIITYSVSTAPFFTSNPYLDYVFFFVILPLPFTAFRIYKRNLLGEIDSLLFDGCDPESYLNIYGYIAGYFNKTDINTNLGVYYYDPEYELYWLNAVFGLVETGGYKHALEILGKFKFYDTNRSNKLNKIKTLYYSILLSSHLWLSETGEAEADLDGLIKAIASLSARSSKKYDKILMLAQYRYNIAIGRFDYAEKAFTEAFNTARNAWERVNSKFYLGEVLLHNGDKEGAKEAFEYVIASGNKLHIVEEAKERLSNIA